ncbi:MAG: P-loop NTPase [bacterium]
MENRYIKVGEKEFGPVSLLELRELVKQGAFSNEDLVWNAATDSWVAAGSVAELNELFKNQNGNSTKSKIYAIASGKGGVGKTITTCSLGVALASMGSDVILVDADLGGPDLHTCMGILEPKFSFFDFYTLQCDSLNDIVIKTPIENLGIISGACGTLGLANPRYFQKQRIIREFKNLQAQYVILDLGAGSSYNVIDFFLLADEKILIVSPEPTAVHEAFGFIKICLLRMLHQQLKGHPSALEILSQEEVNRPGRIQFTVADLLFQIESTDPAAVPIFKSVLDTFRPKLIVNLVKDREEIKEGQAIQAAARELLSIQVDYLGYISYDEKVSAAVKGLKPFLVHDPKSQAAQDLAALIRVKLLGKKGFKEILERRKWKKNVKQVAREYPDADLLKGAPICSVNCFYWGDCEYQDGGQPCRVRHLEPAFKD